jgi:hypothetical protein
MSAPLTPHSEDFASQPAMPWHSILREREHLEILEEMGNDVSEEKDNLTREVLKRYGEDLENANYGAAANIINALEAGSIHYTQLFNIFTYVGGGLLREQQYREFKEVLNWYLSAAGNFREDRSLEYSYDTQNFSNILFKAEVDAKGNKTHEMGLIHSTWSGGDANLVRNFIAGLKEGSVSIEEATEKIADLTIANHLRYRVHRSSPSPFSRVQ